jgi:hypothetical protein
MIIKEGDGRETMDRDLTKSIASCPLCVLYIFCMAQYKFYIF